MPSITLEIVSVSQTGGGTPFTNLSNVDGGSESNYAFVLLDFSNPTSQLIVVSFSVGSTPLPAGATIVGWQAGFFARRGPASNSKLGDAISTTIGGAAAPTSYGGAWPDASGWVPDDYPATSTDTWGLSGGGLPSAADVNTLGAELRYQISYSGLAFDLGNEGDLYGAFFVVNYTGGDPFPAGYEQSQVGQSRHLWPHLAMRERIRRHGPRPRHSTFPATRLAF